MRQVNSHDRQAKTSGGKGVDNDPSLVPIQGNEKSATLHIYQKLPPLTGVLEAELVDLLAVQIARRTQDDFRKLRLLLQRQDAAHRVAVPLGVDELCVQLANCKVLFGDLEHDVRVGVGLDRAHALNVVLRHRALRFG